MENLKLDIFKKQESAYYPIYSKNYCWQGTFEYLMWYKVEEKTTIISVGTKGLLAFNIPAFCLN